MPTREAFERLGVLLASRRAELGLTQDDVHAAGGPSPDRQQVIEAGNAHRLWATTMHGYDTALRLDPGSTQRALSGGQLQPARRSPLDDPEQVDGAIDDLPADVQEEIRRGIDLLPEVRARLGHRAVLASMQHLIDLANRARDDVAKSPKSQE